MYKIIRNSDSTVREIAETYQARNYITKDLSPNVSLAINTAKQHKELETTQYDRIYYVIDGELDITIEGETAKVNAGDSVFISKGSEYHFGGTFEAVVVNQPAFGA
ncbi:hypothetical protein CYG49_02225 [Candidatus Saccharibacteria bacterium]|nr:MAG: hypothetical protein CYG49_02225 [Candidatus Saccharibacteria bacterium]